MSNQDLSFTTWIACHWKEILVEWIVVFCVLWTFTQVSISYKDPSLLVCLFTSLLLAVGLVRWGPTSLRIRFRRKSTASSDPPTDIVLAVHSVATSWRGCTEDLSLQRSYSNLSDAWTSSSPSTNEKSDFLVVDKIAEFWKNSSEYELKRIQMQGTISQYAPFVIGPPAKKRAQHLELRQPGGDGINPDTLNLLMAFTAGQMVWTLQPCHGFRFFGLYQAIVRNSIPLVVSEEYYNTLLRESDDRDQFQSCRTFEATVRGTVVRLPRRFEDMYHAWTLPSSKVRPTQMGAVYAILVDDMVGSLEFREETKYLDGDAWIAIDYQGKQSLESRFCDLSNETDVSEQIQDLKEQLNKQKPGYKIVYQFDQSGEEKREESSSKD